MSDSTLPARAVRSGWQADVDALVSAISCERPVGLEPPLADLFEASAVAVRECIRLIAAVPHLWERPDDYRTLAEEVARVVEQARAVYLQLDIRLRRAGGPNAVLEALNDALTVRQHAPTPPITVRELNPILTRLYTARSRWFNRVEGRGIIDRMLDQLARVPPTAPERLPTPSNTVDESLADRLARLQATGQQVESLAADYRAALQPLRDALQAVADAPLEDRSRWAEAVSAVARRLSLEGMGDVPSTLRNIPRWGNAFDAGRPGRALVGQALCEALAGVIATGTSPTGFFAVLDNHSFITSDEAAREICDVLSHFMHILTERTAPRFAERCALVRSAVGMCSETLQLRLAQCGVPLSSDAGAAIHDWEESRTPWPIYPNVEIRPSTSDTPRVDLPPPTGSTPAQLTPETQQSDTKRPKVRREEAEVRVRNWLKETAKDDPEAVSLRAVAKGTGVSVGGVANTSAWQAFENERKKRASGTPRSVPLTDDILLSRADDAEDEPPDVAARNEDEAVWARILQAAESATERAQLVNLPESARHDLIELTRQQEKDEATDR
jgi:hypothetical protein